MLKSSFADSICITRKLLDIVNDELTSKKRYFDGVELLNASKLIFSSGETELPLKGNKAAS